MPLPIKKLLEHNALLFALLATLVIASLSLGKVPKLNLALQVKSGDKYLHFAAYFSLTLLWIFALRDHIGKSVYKIFVPLALIIYGIILEGLQSGLTSYRTGDIYDAIANTLGVLGALMLHKWLLRWYDRI